MPDNKGELLFKTKQTKILLSLKNNQQPWHITTLSQASGTTYVHTSNFIKRCEELGITVAEKHGKIKEIKLTEKGLQIAGMISSIYAAMAQPTLKTPEPPKEQQKEKQ